MANTYVDYTGDNSETDFIFNFDYLQDDHVKVKVNDVIVTNYSIVEVSADNVIRFNTAPASNASIRIYRDSRGDFSPLVDFVDGSVLTGDNLDEAYKHNLFVSQEASEGTGNELLNKKGGANYDAEGNKIINLGTPTASTDAANKGYTDQTIDNAIALGGSPAIVSLGGYDVTALGTSDTRALANWTNDLNSPTATGSTTARSLADRFADVANVKDYGDDIQSALDSGKGSVFIPDGTYVTDVLTVPSTVQRLYGTGTIKQQAAGNSKLLTATSVTGLIIEGLTFEGIYTTANPPLSSNRGLEFTTCTDLRISNCTVKNVQERAIQLTGCENVIVHGNRLTQCGRGLYLTGTNRVTVSNNIIQDTITDIGEFTIALALDSTDGHSYGVCNEVNISNNIIEGYFHGQGILAHGGRNVSIIGNTVKDPVQSIAIIPFQAGDATQRFTVSGNTLECSTSAISGYTGQNGGITFQGDSDVSIPDPTDVAITGNTIINANRIVEQQYQGGIQIGYSERVQITGNTIINAACNGIVLTDTEESVTITGNVISSVLYGTTANSQNGILIGDVSKGIIDGNMFDNLTNTIGRGINFDGAAKITVGDNSFRDVTTNIRNDVRLLNVTSGTSLDLDNISTVVFNHSTPTTISTFTNVILDKIYTFRFNNSNTTIDRTNAALNGGSNITGSTNDVVLMIGKSSTELRQVAPISVNS
jgi:parallel beta-helix repeat protein